MAPPVLVDLAGKRQAVRFQRVQGGWQLDRTGSHLSGLLFMRIGSFR
jgi:hypothetical protein